MKYEKGYKVIIKDGLEHGKEYGIHTYNNNFHGEYLTNIGEIIDVDESDNDYLVRFSKNGIMETFWLDENMLDIISKDDEEEIEEVKKEMLTFDKLTTILIVNDDIKIVVNYEDTTISFNKIRRYGGTQFTTDIFDKLKDKEVISIKPLGDVIEITVE